MGLRIGTIEVGVPVVLAPMAGITNPAYRQLCREQAEQGAPGIRPAGLFVCEMITSRGVVERIPKTFEMLHFDAADPVKSVQLYGVDPEVIAKATAILCGELGIDHVDLNFGCPVPKVTRRGGGGVLPWKRDRLEAILRAAVTAAEPYGVPVTMKTRKGIDDDHLTYLDAGRIAEQSGVAAIALHGRTVAQAYGGDADWEAIAQLVDAADQLHAVDDIAPLVGAAHLQLHAAGRAVRPGRLGRGLRSLSGVRPESGEACLRQRRRP